MADYSITRSLPVGDYTDAVYTSPHCAAGTKLRNAISQAESLVGEHLYVVLWVSRGGVWRVKRAWSRGELVIDE